MPRSEHKVHPPHSRISTSTLPITVVHAICALTLFGIEVSVRFHVRIGYVPIDCVPCEASMPRPRVKDEDRKRVAK